MTTPPLVRVFVGRPGRRFGGGGSIGGGLGGLPRGRFTPTTTSLRRGRPRFFWAAGSAGAGASVMKGMWSTKASGVGGRVEWGDSDWCSPAPSGNTIKNQQKLGT